jgi:hypothetical protein
MDVRGTKPRHRALPWAIAFALVAAMPALTRAAGPSCAVNSNTDDPGDGSTTGASNKVTDANNSAIWNYDAGQPNVITLRDCIVAANLLTGSTGAPTTPGMTIDLSAIGGQTITLLDNLPLLFNNMAVSAGVGGTPVTIDGGGAHRIFFVSGLPSIPGVGLPSPDDAQPISVSLITLTLQNGKASGGTAFDGGGGMGAGGALFINKAATTYTYNVNFSGNAAVGGSFANSYANGGGGGGSLRLRGGGGLGGMSGTSGSNGSGGGGIGTNSTSGNGSVGGGFGGTGIGQISNAQAFGAGFGGGAYDSSGNGGIGGGGGAGSNTVHLGGFGGGGGTDQFYGGHGGFGGGGASSYGIAGKGGFGGGGGSGGRTGFSSIGAGGKGGFGSGGGGCVAACPSAAGIGGVGGGSGVRADPPQGGGGAGFGGAVFMRGGGKLYFGAYAHGGGIAGGSASAGLGGSITTNGAASASGLFLASGALAVFNVANQNTFRITDSIGDDSATSLPPGGSYGAGCTLGGNDNGDPSNGTVYPCGASLLKEGTGTLLLDSVANTYAGTTTVFGGTVGGTGTIAGPVDLYGVLSPGDPAAASGIGTLNTGALHWETGGTVALQLGATPSASDLLNVNGALVKAGSTFAFAFGCGDFCAQVGSTYTLIQSTDASAFTSGDFSFTIDATYQDLQGTFSINGNAVQFTVDSVTPDRVFSNGFD